jgi:hypothetical protein
LPVDLVEQRTAVEERAQVRAEYLDTAMEPLVRSA